MSSLRHVEAQDLRGAEVRNFQRVVIPEHQVRGLDVAVDDVVFVRIIESGASLLKDANRTRHRKLLAAFEQ